MCKIRCFALCCVLLLTTTHIDSKTAKKNIAPWPTVDSDDVESWTGLWFPHAPRKHSTAISAHNDDLLKPQQHSTSPPENESGYVDSGTESATSSSPRYSSVDYSSLDAPSKLSKTGTIKKASAIPNSVENEIESWTGGWFPHAPNKHPTQNAAQNNIPPPSEQAVKTKSNESSNADTPNVQSCDDAKHSIAIDFDPLDKRHSYNYLCLANRTLYAPNLQREPVLVEHFVPPAYEPPLKCQNVSISYNEMPPTYGSFRMQAPQYGSYVYLPPQRWLHSLADGAIVLLYHPCANPSQVSLLQNTLKGCIYRHIITPSQTLTPERPLALLSWGKCLQMSVVDEHIVVDFIKQNAKKGSKSKRYQLVKHSQLYAAGLVAEAHLVTDVNDSEICGYKEM